MKKIISRTFMAIGALFVLAVFSILLTAIKDGRSIIGTTETVTQKVIGIYDSGNYDIGFRLEGDNNHYYINRGLEQGLTIAALKDKYLNKELAVSYVSQFSILDLDRSVRHINHIALGEEIVYNEFKD